MRVFILEDDANRIMLMLAAIGELSCNDVQVCKSVKDAKVEFNPSYDLILLDHDLADEHYGGDVDKTEGTGQEFVKWMVENHSTESMDSPTVIVHSMNYAGGTRMLGLLRTAAYDAYRIPFGMNVLQLLMQMAQVSKEA